MIPDQYRLKIVVSILQKGVLVAAALFFAWYFWRHYEYFADVLANSFGCLLALISLYVAGIALQAISFAGLFSVEERSRFSGLLGFWGSTTLLGYVAPFAPSVLVRSLFFYKKGIKPAAYTLKTISWILVSMMMAILLAGVSLLAVLGQSSWILLLALPLVLVGVFFMPYGSRLQSLLTRWLFPNWLAGSLVSSEPLPASTVPLVCAQYIVVALCYVLAFRAINLELPLAEGILLSVAIILGALLPLFPNGVGIVEAVVGGVAVARGSPGAEVGAALFFLRFAHIAACFVLVGFSWLISRFGLPARCRKNIE